ncbi:hypothetical protein D3C87_1624860 [compost metagenome]
MIKKMLITNMKIDFEKSRKKNPKVINTEPCNIIFVVSKFFFSRKPIKGISKRNINSPFKAKSNPMLNSLSFNFSELYIGIVVNN